MTTQEKEREFAFHEETLVHSEINFLKNQQWAVTAATLGLFVGLVRLHDSSVGEILKYGLGQWIPAGIVLFASMLLWDLEVALCRQRKRSAKAREILRPGERTGPRRKVGGMLSFAVLGGAILVSDKLEASMQVAMIPAIVTFIAGSAWGLCGADLRRRCRGRGMSGDSCRCLQSVSNSAVDTL